MKSPKNIAASVRQRLLNFARRDHRPFNELLQYYAMERFLFRLSKSKHSNKFILKGALLLRVWHAPELRPTMDIDMLGKTNNSEASIVEQVQDILAVEIEPDGLIFDSSSIQSERITQDADYKVIRVRFRGILDSARINIQLDIGFGDIVYPKPIKLDFPTVLDFPTPRLLCYSRESAIAEKFEAMIKLGLLNSRMKDFYDIWLLSRQFNFEGASLSEAIRLTLAQRGTEIPTEFEIFQESFIADKKVQWTAFCKRLKQENVPNDFKVIVIAIEMFLGPVAVAVSSGQRFRKNWSAANAWN